MFIGLTVSSPSFGWYGNLLLAGNLATYGFVIRIEWGGGGGVPDDHRGGSRAYSRGSQRRVEGLIEGSECILGDLRAPRVGSNPVRWPIRGVREHFGGSEGSQIQPKEVLT